MGDDITIGVTEIVNNIEVTAQPNDQIVDISVIDNTDEVTLNITPTVIEINVNKGSSFAKWGDILGTLSDQEDLQDALDLRVPYTGATSNVNLGEYGLTSGYLKLDTTPTSTPTTIGTIFWDAANRTAALIDGDGDTTLQIGQEQRILVHNNTGSTLTDGQVVYVTGSTGNLPSVSLADATSENTSAATIGVVTESIANGADGFITISGIVNGLNTLAFDEGDLLWLSTTAGAFTTTKPASPAHLVLIGYVIKKAGGNGSILVKIQNTQELSESSDVLFTSLANNDILTYESSSSLWKNKSISTILGYTPANASGTSNYLPKFTGTTSLGNSQIFDNGNNVAVGSINPLNKLYVYSTSIADGLSIDGTQFPSIVLRTNGAIKGYAPFVTTANGGFFNDSLVGDMGFRSESNRVLFGVGANPSTMQVSISSVGISGSLLTTGNVTASKFIKSGGTAFEFLKANGDVDSNIYFKGSVTAGYLPKSLYPSSGDFTTSLIYDDGTNIGIGTTSPSTICHLYKASFPILTIQSSSYQSSLGIDTTSGNLVLNNESNAPLSFNTNATERMRITSGGNVGIGTTSPLFQLQLSNDSAAKPGSPLWTVSSDIRIKENVRPYTDGLEKLMQVNPVYYDYNGKAGFSITKDNVGIIAQEMQEVLPNTIKTFKAKLNDDDEEETELLSFNANEIIYVLINSVKELKAEIEILKNK